MCKTLNPLNPSFPPSAIIIMSGLERIYHLSRETALALVEPLIPALTTFTEWPLTKSSFSSKNGYASSLLTPNPSVKESPSATIKVCEKQIPENEINPRISNANLKKKFSEFFNLFQLVPICFICEKKAERDSRLSSFFTFSEASPIIGTARRSGSMLRRKREGSCLMLSP